MRQEEEKKQEKEEKKKKKEEEEEEDSVSSRCVRVVSKGQQWRVPLLVCTLP